MSDKTFFPLMVLVILMLVATAMVWPQGEGARSPGPFGHLPTQQTPEAVAKRLAEANARRLKDATQNKTAPTIPTFDEAKSKDGLR